MTLVWNKCEGDSWCPFMTVNVDHPHFVGKAGVYVIWHGAPNPKTVYVGKGNIAERIRAHRAEPNIIKHQANGGLFVTWAPVLQNEQDGVESHLIRALQPLENKTTPSATPITVNHPWA